MAAEGSGPGNPIHYSSSPTSLSSPPSALSDPGSPTRLLNQGRANIEMDEIIVDPGSASRFGTAQRPQPQPGVVLTAAGLPRKKPGRKPGSTVKPKAATDGSSTNTEPPKQRRPRKPRDPSAPPIQRKRKAPAAAVAATENAEEPMQIDSDSLAGPPRINELTSMRMSLDEPTAARNPPKRDSKPGSMMSILNDEPAPRPQPPASATNTTTITATRQRFDPVRDYDPVREAMVARDPYGTGPLGSPRAPSQVVNHRASASPSIASLVDPPSHTMSSVPPHQSYNNATVQSRFHDSNSLPPSPSHPTRSAPEPARNPTPPEIKRPPPPAPSQTKPEPPKNGFTSMTSIPSAAAAATNGAPAPPVSKKVAAVAQQGREKHQKTSVASSSSNISGVKDGTPNFSAGAGRSILDFGKANPGEEFQAPSIVLHIPLNGETNKYVNFMRMAEERFGWDALHPRLAAHRERKARIAAASAALEKTGSGRESGDEMSVDLQSDGEGSNAEMGGMGNGEGGTGNGAGGTSGPDGAPAKPARKKRNFKEDEYDKADDFVDDSELLWEEQAAASRDGFFVYSGPLIPEVEKPAAGETPPRRGRGGRGSRGGARGGTTRGEGTGRGRGGGPGSRGGAVPRKPRITKLEKEQRDREKAERERLAQTTSMSGAGSGYGGVQPGSGIGQNNGTGVAA